MSTIKTVLSNISLVKEMYSGKMVDLNIIGHKHLVYIDELFKNKSFEYLS